MRLTKFVHSCVLVEDNEKSILFDPGIFSWKSGLVDVAKLPQLDTIAISHRHPDHFAEPFVDALALRHQMLMKIYVD
jgi:L-ascorbate metabolism protein UlaG (beta-lactamase superfamily)